MRRFLALFLVLVLLPLGPLAEEQAMDNFAKEAFRSRKVTGGAVVIAWKGKVLYSYAYGYKDARQKQPVTLDTCFRIASVTKLVTAVGLLHLLEEKDISLDTPVNDLLPFPVNHPSYPDQKITIRQLLSHTSGMEQTQYYFPKWETMGVGTKYFNEKNSPGAKFNYSNLNGGLMGALIESISGQSLNSYMQQNVFDPLKINAAYHPALLHDTSDIADQMTKQAKLVMRAEKALASIDTYDDTCSPREHTNLSSGKLYISANGLIRIISMLQQGGSFGGVRILSKEMVQEMMLPQCEIEGSSVTGESPYGLSLHRVENMPGGTWYGHQGRYDGLSSNIYFQPDTGLTVTVIANGYSPHAKDDIVTIARFFMEEAQQYVPAE